MKLEVKWLDIWVGGYGWIIVFNRLRAWIPAADSSWIILYILCKIVLNFEKTENK